MKKFNRLVGLLLCLAMVLSFVPASIISVAAADTTTRATVTTDILEKIDLTGTVVGACSDNASGTDYANYAWYSTAKPTWSAPWKTAVVDGMSSTALTYNAGGTERADYYLDLSKTSAGYTTVDKIVINNGGDTAVPSITVILVLANGSTQEKTFTTNWSVGATASTTWTLDQTQNVKGVYVWEKNNTRASFGDIEMYHYVQVEALETAKLNGVDLSEYKIVYSASDLDYAKTAAEYIQEQILKKTGRQVDVVTDATAESTYEIQVGNVNRTYAKSISAPSETAMKFTFASNGSKIAMKADYFIIAGAAYYFVETYIGDTDFDVTVNTGVTTQNTITKPAKNYIMMIGDGMGEMHTRLFEIYDVPTSGNYAYSDGEDIFYGYYFPYMGWSQTANIYGEVTDSAAGGTALSTGYKTINGYVGKDQYLNDVKNLSELAMEYGKSVAVMSTEGSDGATPASFSAHSDGRYNDDEILADQKNFGGLLIDGYNNYSSFTASEWNSWEPLVKAGLNSVSQDPDGFFIMYEEAHIDKNSHRLNYTSSAGYTGDTDREVLFRTVYRFNQAIGIFMEYAMYNPDTFVMITADHETSGLNSNFIPTYGNPVDEQKYGSVWDHSLMDVPVFTYGVGAEIFDDVTATNASVGRTFADVMTGGNADDFGDPSHPIIGGGSSGGSTVTVAPLPSNKITDVQFGYYTNNNTDGAITPYYQDGREPAYLIDGGATNQTRSQYYLHSEITSGAKVPVLYFGLSEATVLSGIKINGYEYGRYNMEDFEIQVYTESGWVTVASWNDAFVDGTRGNDVSPLQISFQTPVTATKLRILVSQISDMSSEQEDPEDVELLEGGYIRVKEVTLYYDTAATPGETPTPDQPTTNPTAAPTTPTQTPTLPEGGELTQGEIYKIINNKTYLTGIAGYINASGTFVEVSGEGECLVEGAYARCAFLNQNISGEKAAIAEIDLSTTKKIGAIEIVGDRNTQLDPTNFEIQVWYNGAWTTVKTVTNAFVSGSRSVRYTFGPVETNKVRLYITKHEGDYCSIGEIELYEVTTGNVANKIDLSGCTATSDSGVTAAGTLTSAVVGSVIDGDKSTIITFNSNYPTIAIDLTNSDGTPTNISAFSLFGNRSGNRPVTVEIQVQLTNGGSYTSLGTYSFSANNVTSYPFQPYYTELGGSYDAYGFKMIVKSLNYAETAGCALAEIELYGSGEGTAPENPETPTEPTQPTEAPAEGTMQKIDLTGTVVGIDSQNSATESDFTKFTWYSTLNPTWKDITIPVNGNYDDEVHWGLDPHERGDIYLDLTRINASGVAASQLKLYHSQYRNVPSLVVILKLVDGTFIEKTFTLGWQEGVAADPFVYTFDDTYQVAGVYLWENQSNENLRATFGEIEMFYKVGDEPATPPATEPTTPPATEAPTTPPATEPVVGTGLKVVSPTLLSTKFGYYADGTGANESTFWDGNDGYCVTDGWFGRAGYSECTPSQGKVALLIDLSQTKTLGGIEITGNGTSYDPVDFDVQAYVNGAWVTVYSQDTNAFSSSIRTVMFEFDQTVTTNKIRVLINTVSGGSSSQCRLQEVVLFETAEKAYANIDLTGKGSSTDANAANPIGNLVDNSKDSIFLGSNATFNFGTTATKIDGFRLFNYRGNNNHPTSVQVKVKLTADGAFTEIGTFSTGWSSSYPLPIMDVEFGQTYEVYGIQFNFGIWGYINGLEVYQYVEAASEPSEPDTILVGGTYSIHLVEPWALRTTVKFARNTADNLIPVSEFTSYGAYAIISNKFDGTTAEDLMADSDAVHYSSTLENVTAGETSFTFDFYDGLYAYNLNESVYWVAYFVTAEGTHYTGIQTKSLTDVADNLIGKDDVSTEEKAVLESMKDLNDAVIALRGEDADLGHTYAAGVANPGTLGDRNTGYQFGTSSQIKLIEPWGMRVRVLMREKTAAAGVYADYDAADDYGLIFFHDIEGIYNGTMTTAQMKAETNAKVYSKLEGNAIIHANGVTAVYDHEIYTQDLDSKLYCLPYIVVDGQYYYPQNVISWNLLAEMTEYSENTELSAEERAVFNAMITMYENVQAKLN